MKTEPDILQDKQQRYEFLRKQYHLARDMLNSEINSHQIQINEHKKEISKLEEQIKETRPRTDKGEKICESCDMTSMKYIGLVPGQGRRIHCYECEICGRQYSH